MRKKVEGVIFKRREYMSSVEVLKYSTEVIMTVYFVYCPVECFLRDVMCTYFVSQTASNVILMNQTNIN